MLAKEQIVQGRVGNILGIQSRVYNTRAQMLEILKRSPEATPVLDALTYYVDMACWYMGDSRPVEVIARSNAKVFRAMGHEVDDVTWSIITFRPRSCALASRRSKSSRLPNSGSTSR
ncbi:MAG: hypothetical protein ACE1Y7_14265 [Lysobacteraceae bacterium]